MTSTEPILFDPEFEAVLRDVAADPRSGLLRVRRPSMLPELFESHVPIHARATGLTSAERHLVQVHRAEVAWLLRQACLVKLIEGPRSKRFVSPYAASGKKVELLSDAQMRREVGEQSTLSGEIAECEDGLSLLKRCVVDRVGDEPEVAEMATASLRLEPTDQARLMVAIDLANRGEPRTALGLLHGLLSTEPSMSCTCRAWECIGRCLVDLQDLERAHVAYTRADSTGEPLANARLARMLLAVQLGLRDDAITTDQRVDEIVLTHRPSIDWFIELQTADRRSGKWTPSAAGRQLARLIGDCLSPMGRRVADVLN